MALKLISVNIERSKHLSRVLPFIETEKPDVLCVQELMEYDIPALESVMGTRAHYAPMSRHPAEDRMGMIGIAIFSTQASSAESRYYVNDGPPEQVFDFASAATKHATEAHVLALARVHDGAHEIAIGTTHFTWTPDGEADDFQRADLAALFAVLPNEIALCGDFNAPRGREIFSRIAERYRDNIPAEYATSIDGDLHRAGHLPYMVDGLFTTPHYAAKDVRLVKGVSDHMAIVATIEKGTAVH